MSFMKGSKYIIAIFGAFIMSCSNFTDIQPTHSLTPNNAFKTMSDIELHLNGIYSGFQSTGYYALAYGTLADMMSDNLAENVESLGNYRSTVDWLYVANDGTVEGVWATPYSMINDCNILLSNVDKFKEAKVTCQLIIKEGGAHGWQNRDVEEKNFLDWFDKYLK